MSGGRIKAGLWVQAALRLGDSASRPGMVVRRGDADAGGVLVVLRARTELVILTRIADPDGGEAWLRATGAAPVAEAEADAYIARRLKSDPDLWVVEFEAPDLLPPFEAKLV
jgi:hypothetical protein